MIENTSDASGGDKLQLQEGDLEELAFRTGSTYDTYLSTEPGLERFWSGSGRGCVAYLRRGRYVNVCGGLIADRADRGRLLREFTDFIHRSSGVVSFYNICETDLELFRDLGYQVTRWGKEALIDLPEQSWQGKQFEWVRRQSNYCRRQGLEVEEVLDDAPDRGGVFDEVRQIGQQSLASKPQARELKFVQGLTIPNAWGRRRLFVARNGRGRIEGFLTCLPGQAGELWSFETFRSRPDSVRGTTAYLMHQVLQRLQLENVETVSLCLVPGMGCEQPILGDCGMTRRLLNFTRTNLGFVYDINGLLHFKSRFRPRFEDRFVCVSPQITVGSLLAFAHVTGVFYLSPLQLWRSWRDRRTSNLSMEPQMEAKPGLQIPALVKS